MSNENDEDIAQESSSAELDAEKPNAAATPQSAQPAAELDAEKPNAAATPQSAQPAAELDAGKPNAAATPQSAQPAAELDAGKPNAAATPQSAQPAAELISAIQAIRISLSIISSDLEAIKNYIARKDEELSQWQEGYDLAKRKELLGEYANWLDYLEGREKRLSQSEAPQETHSEVKAFRETMELSMENFSLESIRPSKGEDFEAWRGRAEIVGPVETTNASEDGKIAELVSSGVLYTTGVEGGIVVRLAKVRVWRKSSTT